MSHHIVAKKTNQYGGFGDFLCCCGAISQTAEQATRHVVGIDTALKQCITCVDPLVCADKGCQLVSTSV